MKLEETIKKIQPFDKEYYSALLRSWNELAHPVGSLGKLEEISSRVIAITGDENYNPNKRAWCVFCADNGIVDEGVSCQPKDQTALIAEQMVLGNTAAALLAKRHNIDLYIVDVGLLCDPDERFVNKKVALGTGNFSKERAMTKEEAVSAIEAGIEMGDELFYEGYNIFMAGELGIGNTSTSSAVLSALTSFGVDETVGRGAGVNNNALIHKKEVIKNALNFHKPDGKNPIEVLSKVGGFDIGAMAGFYLSAAKNKVPVILDGFISSVAALLSKRLCEYAVDYMISSHCSAERGTNVVIGELSLKPFLELDMRLGEGSGCPLALSILEDALYLYRNMYRFENSRVDGSYLKDFRSEETEK